MSGDVHCRRDFAWLSVAHRLLPVAEHPSPELPAVDERLVAPGSGYEIIDGMLVHVPPADPPHAMRQSKGASLFEAYTRAEYDVATQMLTRTSKIARALVAKHNPVVEAVRAEGVASGARRMARDRDDMRRAGDQLRR